MYGIYIRKDVYDELIEKGFGKKDMSKLHLKIMTDKNGHQRKVWVKGEEKQTEKRTPKMQNSENKTSQAHTRGDIIIFEKNGQRLTGQIVDLGRIGVTIKGNGKTNGQIFQVPHRDVKQVTKMINPQDAIRSLMDKESIKAGWRGTDGMQPKSCDTIDGLLKSVEAVRGEFSEITDSIKSKFEALNPIIMKRATLKSVDRIKEKLREDEKEYKKGCLKTKSEYTVQGYDEKTDTYHCQSIRDCDGHTICLNSVEEVANILKYLDKQSYAARIKNNFGKPSPVGYSDINANIKLSNGIIVELQINTTANMVAKERYGHALYEVYRSVESNPEYKQLANVMADAQKALYGLSNEYSKKGNYPVSNIPKKDGNVNIFDGEYKHEPYAAVIRDKVKEALPLFQKAKKSGLLNGKTIEHFEHLISYIK